MWRILSYLKYTGATLRAVVSPLRLPVEFTLLAVFDAGGVHATGRLLDLRDAPRVCPSRAPVR